MFERTAWLTRELLAYSAAGATLIGVAEAAEGAIVYLDFPDVTVDRDQPSYGLDLDGDALADFTFVFTDPSRVGMVGTQTNGVATPYTGGTGGTGCPSTGTCGGGGYGSFAGLRLFAASTLVFAFPPGQVIDGARAFANSVDLPAIQNGYFGLRFLMGDQEHFGWVRAEVTDMRGTFYDAAYESQPGVGIAAGVIPETASLALLALGAAGVSLRRHRAGGSRP